MSVLSPGWGREGERPGLFGLFFIGIWTLFLLQPLQEAWDHRDTLRGWLGILLVLAFTAWYLVTFARRRIKLRMGSLHVSTGTALLNLTLGVVLAVLTCVAVGQKGSATAVYLAVVCVMTLPNPWAIILALVNNGLTFLAGLLVPRWDADPGLLLSTMAATVAVWGIQQVIVRNTQLVAAHEENQRLVVSEERNRFARDLHDILGHSLTVITVKAELAQRLLEVDTDRARAELVDLERLSRDALTDVRRAVEGYRELTLPGELARARMALDAAGIRADLPNSTDDVPSELRELYAWVVREGVTNVLRHSHATRCSVRIGPKAVEVTDDGAGPCASGTGSGLLGLRERAAAVGGTVVTRGLEPGFSLRVVTAP